MKKKGTVFIVLGLLLIVGAFGLTAYNLITQDRAEKASAEIMGALEQVLPETREVENGIYVDSVPENSDVYTAPTYEVPDYILNPDMDMPTITVGNATYVGTISIPVLDLELPIHSDWDYTKLKTAPCVFSGTIYKDDLVICAHNYRKHFSKLRTLHSGDTVVITDADGNEFVYEVWEIEILQPTDLEAMIESDYDLTLYTCTTGGKTRLTVRCNKVEKY